MVFYNMKKMRKFPFLSLFWVAIFSALTVMQLQRFADKTADLSTSLFIVMNILFLINYGSDISRWINDWLER